MQLVFHGYGAFINFNSLCLAGVHKGVAAVGGQLHGEAVAADRHNAQIDGGYIVHCPFLQFLL